MKLSWRLRNGFGLLLVTLVGVILTSAQFGYGAQLTLTSVYPTSIDCDPALGGDASFTAEINNYFGSGLTIYYSWQWECNGKYWDGENWVSTSTWVPIDYNTDPFWAPSSLRASGPKAIFTLPRSNFPEAFWSQAVPGGVMDSNVYLNVNLKIKYSYSTVSYTSNALSIEFHRPFPKVSVYASQPQTLTVIPSQTKNWHFEVPFSVTGVQTPNPANIVWTWTDAATGLYWNGSAWASQAHQTFPSANNSGFWQLSSVSTSAIKMDIPTAQFTSAFWDGSLKQVQLMVGYQDNGKIYWAETPSQIQFALREEMALKTISPGSLDADPDLGGSLSSTIKFNHWTYGTPDLTKYDWSWRIYSNGHYMFWNGENWTTSGSWIPIHENSGTFWNNSYVTQNQQAVFAVDRQDIPDAFWELAQDSASNTESITIEIWLRYTGGSSVQNANKKILTLTKPTPTVAVSSSFPQTLSVNPTQTKNWHFEVPYQISHVVSPMTNIVWSWKDTVTGLYWNGTAWTSQPYQNYPAASNDGFWALSSATDSGISMDIPTAQFTDAFWSGSQKQVQLQVGYLHKASILWAETPSQILFKLKETLVLNSLNPAVLEVDLDQDTFVSFNLLFDHWMYETQDINQFSWQWKVGNYFNAEYWDGNSWSSNASWNPVHVNSNPFWGPSNMAMNQKAVFRLLPSNFPAEFWQKAQDTGAGSESLSVSVRLRYSGGTTTQTSGFGTVEFTKPWPSVNVGAVSPQSLLVNPDSEQSSIRSLDVPYSVTHIGPFDKNNVVWCWRDSSTLKYWDGTAWVPDQPVIAPAASNSGFWSGDSVTESMVSLDVLSSKFNAGFWTEPHVLVKIQVGYRLDGKIYWSQNSTSIDIKHVEAMELYSITPNSFSFKTDEYDPNLDDPVSFTLDFKHWYPYTISPNQNAYYMRWECKGKYWNGQEWVSNSNIFFNTNSDPFWANSSLTGVDTADFSLPRSEFPETFWDVTSADPVTVNLRLGYYNGTYAYISETLPIDFHRPYPVPGLGAVQPQALLVEPTQPISLHLELPYTIHYLPTPVQSKVVWRWEHGPGNYWDGTQWTSEDSFYYPKNNDTGFWEGASINASTISLDVMASQFVSEFWSEPSMQVQIRVGYLVDGQIDWTDETASLQVDQGELLTVLSVGPKYVDCDPDLSENPSFQINFQNNLIANPDKSNYLWKWQYMGYCWDGQAWTTTETWISIHDNPAPFWEPSFIDQDSVFFTIDQTLIPEEFWIAPPGGGIRKQDMTISLKYDTGPGGSISAEPFVEHFKIPAPGTPSLDSSSKTFLVDMDDFSSSFHLKINYDLKNQQQPSPNAVRWCWQDVVSKKYWDGSAWITDVAAQDPNVPGSGFWDGTSFNAISPTTGSISIDLEPSDFSQDFWSGADKTIQIKVGYEEGGELFWGFHTLTLIVKLLPPRAPGGIFEEGITSSSTQPISWFQVAGADNYRVALMKPDGTMVDPNWKNNIINDLYWETTPPLKPNTYYRVFVYSYNRAGLSPTPLASHLLYSVPIPQAPVSIQPLGEITTPSPTFTWPEIEGAESYRIGFKDLNSTQEWVDSNWQNSPIQDTQYELSHSLVLGHSYEIYMQSYNTVGSSPVVKVGTFDFDPLGATSVSNSDQTFVIDPNASDSPEIGTFFYDDPYASPQMSFTHFSWKLLGPDGGNGSSPIYWNGEKWVESSEPITLSIDEARQFPFFSDGPGVLLKTPGAGYPSDPDNALCFAWNSMSSLLDYDQFWSRAPERIEITATSEVTFDTGETHYIEHKTTVTFEHVDPTKVINIHTPGLVKVSDTPISFKILFQDLGRTDASLWQMAWVDADQNSDTAPLYWTADGWSSNPSDGWQTLDALDWSGYNYEVHFDGDNSYIQVDMVDLPSLLSLGVSHEQPSRAVRVELKAFEVSENPITYYSSHTTATTFYEDAAISGNVTVTNFGQKPLNPSFPRVVPDPSTGMDSAVFNQKSDIQFSNLDANYNQLYLRIVVAQTLDGDSGPVITTKRDMAIPLSQVGPFFTNINSDLNQWLSDSQEPELGLEDVNDGEHPYYLYAFLCKQPDGNIIYELPPNSKFSFSINGQEILLDGLASDNIEIKGFPFNYRFHSELSIHTADWNIQVYNEKDNNGNPTGVSRDLLLWDKANFAANVGDFLVDQTVYRNKEGQIMTPQLLEWTVEEMAPPKNVLGHILDSQNRELELLSNLEGRDANIVRSAFDQYGIPSRLVYPVNSIRNLMHELFVHMSFEGGDYPDGDLNLHEDFAAGTFGTTVAQTCFSRTPEPSFGIKIFGFTKKPVYDTSERLSDISADVRFKYRHQNQPTGPAAMSWDGTELGWWREKMSDDDPDAYPKIVFDSDGRFPDYYLIKANQVGSFHNIYNSNDVYTHNFFGNYDEGAIIQIMNLFDDRSGRVYEVNPSDVASPNTGPLTVQLKYDGPNIRMINTANPCNEVPYDIDINLSTIVWSVHSNPKEPISSYWDNEHVCDETKYFNFPHEVEIGSSSTNPTVIITPEFRDEVLETYVDERPDSEGYEWYLGAELWDSSHFRRFRIQRMTGPPVSGQPITVNLWGYNNRFHYYTGVHDMSIGAFWEFYFRTFDWTCDTDPLAENLQYNYNWPGQTFSLKFKILRSLPSDPSANYSRVYRTFIFGEPLCYSKKASELSFEGDSSYVRLENLTLTPSPAMPIVEDKNDELGLKIGIQWNPGNLFSDDNPFILDNLRWRWEDLDQPLGNDSYKGWDGNRWVSSFKNFSILSQWVNCTFQMDDNSTIYANMPQNYFYPDNDGFWEGRESVNVRISVDYQGVSSSCVVTFHKPGVLPDKLNSFTTDLYPSEIRIDPSQSNPIHFSLTMNNLDPENVILDPNKILWRWKKDDPDVGVLYWNGTSWGTDETFKSPAELGNFIAQVTPPGIQADFTEDYFVNEFWQGQTSVNCQLDLQYVNADGTIIDAPDSAPITFIQMLEGSIKYPQMVNDADGLPELSELDGLITHLETSPEHIGKWFAPEPIELEANGLASQNHDQYWVLGRFDENSAPVNPATPQTFNNDPSIYQWLKIPFTVGDKSSHHLFVIPCYYDSSETPHVDPFHWDTRSPISLDREQQEWTFVSNQNLAYKFDLSNQRFIIAVFVPASELERGQDATIPEGTSFGSNGINLANMLSSTDSQHNRILTVNHLSGNRLAFSMAFSDLLGRAQEVRAIGSHAPTSLLGQALVSSVTEFDALGRPIKTAKPFYASSNETLYPLTGDRDHSFDAADAFWRGGNSSIDIKPYTVLDSKDKTYSETIYETDPRGRVVAQLPLGKYGDIDSPDYSLRFPRFHYFAVQAPNLDSDLGPLYNLPDLDGGPGLLGTLAVDPEGGVVATFTGNDPDTVLITVANPTTALMTQWGLHPMVGGTPSREDLTANDVYLPANYADRLQDDNPGDVPGENGNSASLVTYNEIDEFGRLKKSYPPRSLKVENSWSIVLDPNEENLATVYTYDRFDRVVEIKEPDAGTTTNKYNKVGWLRFTQNEKQRLDTPGYHWTEMIYDDLGRLVETRDIKFTSNPAWDTLVEDVRVNDDFEIPLSSQYVNFDFYDNDPTNFSWPSQTDLQASYEDLWPDQGAIWGSSYGLQTQISSHNSAERVYYDDSGLVLARVRIIAGINEPHITMYRYDDFDGKLMEVKDQYTGMHYGYVYDAWDRLVQVYDLRPCTWRMRLGVAFQAESSGEATEPDSVTTYLGSLVDPTMAFGNPEEQQAYLLEDYVHTPTGHVEQVNVARNLMSQSFTYDIRDFTVNSTLKAQGSVPIFSQSFKYEDGSAYQSYNGNISQVTDEYGFAVTGEGVRAIDKTYQYDLLSQLLKSDVTWEGTPDISNQYRYDKNGNRLEETRNNVPVEGQPNGENWVLTHSIPSGTNRLGNVQRSIDDGLAGDYVNIDPSVDYDWLGNLKGYTSYSSGSQRDFALTYGDPRFPILPTAIQVDTNDIVTEEYAYDFSGTRVKREIWTDEDGDGEVETDDVTYFIPFGTENQAELDAYGRVKRAYIFAGSDRIGYKGGGDTVVYVKDYLGSTRLTLALNQPSIQDAIRQSAGDNGPYGNTWNEIYLNGGEKEPHQFTGQENEAKLGLYYMGARFYDPDLGRFLQVDPAREFWNSYSYVGNNPIAFKDPNGKASAKEVALSEADWNFRQGNDVAGYAWLGVSGFVEMTDSLSRVFDHHFIKERKDVTGWTYLGAAIELSDVLPLAKMATAAKELCFTEGTPVLTNDGLKPIEKIVVGDQVVSWNFSEEKIQMGTVISLSQKKSIPCLNLTILSTKNIDAEEIVVTLEHPFWVVGEGWVEAKNLQKGQKLFSYGGEIVTVERVATEKRLQTVYNFEVSQTHSYFVGESGVLVHNACEYVRVFIKANPRFEKFLGQGVMEIHHRIPQIFNKLGIVLSEKNSLTNLYALPKKLHRAFVTPVWEAWRAAHPDATAKDVVKFAGKMDEWIAPYINKVDKVGSETLETLNNLKKEIVQSFKE